MQENYIVCNENNFSEIMKNKNIKKIVFSENFNLIIGRNIIPDNITHLKFNDSYEQYIDKDVLPKNLMYLFFGNRYNKTIDVDVLPKSLEILDVGMSYNKPFKKGVLPFGLKELYLNNYDKDISNEIFPDSITHLYFSYNLSWRGVKRGFYGISKFTSEYKKSKIISLPNNLQFLNFETDNYNVFDSHILPEGLQTLIISTKNINITKLPTTLVNLKINYSYESQQKISLFSTNIKKLHLNNYLYPIEKDTLPKNLYELHMYGCNYYLNNNIKLKKLKIFCFCFVGKANYFFVPDSVEELAMPINEKYNNLYNNLPLNIKKITLLNGESGYKVDLNKVDFNNLPITLEKLVITTRYIDASKLKLPFGCQVIYDCV